MTWILVIDDEAIFRESLGNILVQAGFSVLEAKSGREGLEIVQSRRVNIVLCDVMMSELDGFAVLEKLRSDPRTSKIPFIFMTGSTGDDIIHRGIERGADAVLLKPFVLPELLSAIKAALARHEK